jgi:hypothetical protein
MYLLRDNKLIKVDLTEDKLPIIIAYRTENTKSFYKHEYILKCEVSNNKDRTIYIFRSITDPIFGATGEHDSIGDAIKSMIDKHFNVFIKGDNNLTQNDIKFV